MPTVFYNSDKGRNLLSELVGKTIKSITVEDDVTEIVFTDGTKWTLTAGQCQAEGHIRNKLNL